MTFFEFKMQIAKFKMNYKNNFELINFGFQAPANCL